MPCTEKRARLLLERGRARVHKMFPFTIRVVDRLVEDSELQALRIKLDPGSKTTGIALVRETAENGVAVINLFELMHRGKQISEALTARRGHRRMRRSKLRYRAPRFLNRGNKGKGRLAPSLQHRVDTTLAWVNRLQRLAPVSAISTELVRFDMQVLENPDIEGAQYQQGTLAGYEVREYLLEKWGRTCAYCGAKGVPLQIEHIHPSAKGGSNRISNLTLACQCCNQKKGAASIEDFLRKQPERLKRIQAQAKRPLKDAAAVNATRWALVNALKTTGLAVETASGGRTKFNRSQFNIPKTHALDAACVGELDGITGWQKPTLCLKAMGRGSYQRTRLDKFGCVRGYLTRSKSVQGFQTGDLVKAEVTKGKKTGSYTGRVAVRASGSFNIQTRSGLVQGVSHRYCTVVQRGDGYGYQLVAKTDATGTATASQGTRRVPRSTFSA
ncbi:RNA-guided endonuclease IscB [Polaromonas sp.]|uniref:RNA-guided endonuclease IscB n=1 Tax=Polaromonas sp. TaxID=1869339 RepID=UPI003BB5A1DB